MIEQILNFGLFFGLANLWAYRVLEKRGYIERWSTYSPSATFSHLVECLFCTSHWMGTIECLIAFVITGHAFYLAAMFIIPVISTFFNAARPHH